MMLLSIAPKRKSEPEPEAVVYRQTVYLVCPYCRKVHDQLTQRSDDPKPVIRESLMLCKECQAAWQNGWTIPK